MLVIIQHKFLFGESRLKWRPVAATPQQTAPYLVTTATNDSAQGTETILQYNDERTLILEQSE